MQEPKGIFSAIAQPIGEEMARHLAAPPLRQNQDRAVWGTAILTGGTYAAHAFLNAGRIDLWQGVHFYFRVLHARWDTSWPFYLWGGVMLFGLLWVVVGVRNSRAPRQVMTAFWALAWAIFGGAALWNDWYFDGWPEVDWFLKGIYLMIVTGALMLFWLAVRGQGRGAAHLVAGWIATQARVFRLGRRRTF